MTPTPATMIAAPAAALPFNRWLAALRATLSRREAYHETLTELQHLDDRALADLGFARCDLPSVAWEHASAKEGH